MIVFEYDSLALIFQIFNFLKFYFFFLGFLYDSHFISVIHSSFNLFWFTLITFTLQKVEAPFIHPNSFTLRRVLHPVHPSRRVNKLVRTFIHPSGRVKHPYLRVNRVKHPSKGELGEAPFEGWTLVRQLHFSPILEASQESFQYSISN